MKKILKAIFSIIFCLIFMTGCSEFLPLIDNNDDSSDSSNNTNNSSSTSVCQYITKQNNSGESSNITNPNSIESYLDVSSASVRVVACYNVNNEEVEMQTSGFLYSSTYDSSSRKYTYYLVTSSSGIFYRYITNASSDSFDMDNDVNIVRSGLFEITMDDGRVYNGEVVGYFDPYDICIFKFQTQLIYNTIEVANSDEIVVGQNVYTCGTPVGGYNLINTMLKGSVSGIDRLSSIYFSETYNSTNYIGEITSYPTFQFDASVNTGMEGAPVVNEQGKLLGMCGYRYGTDYGDYSYESLSFALPSYTLKPIVDSIISTGSFTKPLLGVLVKDLINATTEDEYSWISEHNIYSGVLITTDGVSEGGACSNANVSDNSVIISLENNSITYQITNLSSLYNCLVRIDPSKPTTLTYYKSDGTIESKVLTLNA